MYFQFYAIQSSMRTLQQSRRGPELSLCAQSTQSLYYPSANHVRISPLADNRRLRSLHVQNSYLHNNHPRPKSTNLEREFSPFYFKPFKRS